MKRPLPLQSNQKGSLDRTLCCFLFICSCPGSVWPWSQIDRSGLQISSWTCCKAPFRGMEAFLPFRECWRRVPGSTSPESFACTAWSCWKKWGKQCGYSSEGFSETNQLCFVIALLVSDWKCAAVPAPLCLSQAKHSILTWGMLR